MRILQVYLLLLGALIPFLGVAQLRVSGTVTDSNSGELLPGVNILIKGTSVGTTTDFDGVYSIESELGDVLVFSYIGYTTQEITVSGAIINAVLTEDAQQLGEVVLIGYGQTTKENATGSVQKIDAETFNKGSIVSPQTLLAGKAAGVNITSAGGQAGAAPQVRIRGGSSLSSTNDPLYVVDGVPLDQNGNGTSNALNAINPDEIEDFTVLKDASATAIYGSRASNGVILITTKRGKAGQPFSVELDLKLSLGFLTNKVDVLSSDEFRRIISDSGSDTSLLGDASTDWQDEIYREAFGGIHNLNFSQGFENFDYRVNFNYTNQEGILKEDLYKRAGINFVLTQRLFDDHLKISLNSKNSLENNYFPDRGAIGAAQVFDPTQPVYDPASPFGGYFEFRSSDELGSQIPTAPRNPVALLDLHRNKATSKSTISNINFDYKFHFLPSLKFNLTAGLGYTEREGLETRPVDAAANNLGIEFRSEYPGLFRNQLLDFYFNYHESFFEEDLVLDATLGHSFQEFYRREDFARTDTGILFLDSNVNRNSLESYFGRVELDLWDTFVLLGSLRRDGSSRFSDSNRWGTFPGASFAWKILKEDYQDDNDFISNLKLRFGWGVQGQQEVGNYLYQPLYVPSTPTATVQFGDEYVSTLRASGYYEDLKWEETTQYNAGIDLGFFDGRLNTTVEGYYKSTKDLLSNVPVPAGSNLTDILLINVGEVTSKGLEISLDGDIVRNEDFRWNAAFNISFQDVEVDNLSLNSDSDYFIPVGGISGGVGNNIQILRPGYDPTTFFVFRQVYDSNGQPIEGAYADVNGDGQITESDRTPYKKASPDAYYGFTSSLSYKKFDMSLTFRGNIGNYVYNNQASNTGYLEAIVNTPGPYYANANNSYLDTGFENNQLFSSYYIQRADFLKLDNISFGYLFDMEHFDMRASLTATNVFVITDYDGTDPEISGGIDNNFYPVARTFILGLNFKW